MSGFREFGKSEQEKCHVGFTESCENPTLFSPLNSSLLHRIEDRTHNVDHGFLGEVYGHRAYHFSPMSVTDDFNQGPYRILFVGFYNPGDASIVKFHKAADGEDAHHIYQHFDYPGGKILVP